MAVAKKYGNVVRKQLAAGKVDRAAWLIRTGLHLESFRTAHLADKRMPDAWRYLNHMAIKEVADALSKPSSFVWTNIFAPTEIMQSFGLSSVSMECLASYLSGFWLEDTLIDRAEEVGIATTLCSYHKNFLGAVEAGIVPAPVAGITTSTICDGNVCSFRHIRAAQNLPVKILDIPHEYSPAAESYVTAQLEELVSMLEQLTGRAYDEGALKTILERENRSKELYLSFLKKRAGRAYPKTLTLHMFTLFATHLSIGTEWALEFFEKLNEEVETYPEFTGKRIFWVHLVPWSQPTLCEYFNYNDRFSIVGDDFNMDYLEPLNVDEPLPALARKILLNVYNGSFERKVEAVERYARELGADGIVEFCHWGCRQSAGGAQLLKSRMRDVGIPMLVLDGDGIDRRGNMDGQIRTRFEAFLELLDAGGDAR